MEKIMGEATNVYVSINKMEGGFVVGLPTGDVVATSLNKAIKLIRDALSVGTLNEAEGE
jgi:hypothetical protein